MAKIDYLNSVLSLKYAYGDVALYQPGDVLEPRKLHDFELVWIMEGRCIYHAEGCDYPAPRVRWSWESRGPTNVTHGIVR